MSGARIIFIHGPPACGKFTIGRELSALTGVPLFHNHLVVDMLLAVFPFGSAPFRKHREQIWIDVMSDAVAGGGSLIFTFNPERTVDPEFTVHLGARIAKAGGTITFVEIACSEAEIERRTEAASRRDSQKLNSRERYRELKRAGAFDYPTLTSECRVDSSIASPKESARLIAETVGLSTGG